MRYVYVMGNTRYPFRYKIGISNNVKFRRESIANSVKGKVYVIFCAKYFYAEKVEMMMHQIYSPLRAEMEGSGKTEWFWLILPVSPIVLLGCIWGLQWFIICFVPATLFYFFTTESSKKYETPKARRIERHTKAGLESPAIRHEVCRSRATTEHQ